MAKKQLEIVGTERPTIEEVDATAEAFVTQRDKRMAMGVKEKAAKLALIEAMKKHKLTVYRDMSASPPLTVMLSAKDDVKVTEANTGNEEEGDDE